MSQPTPSYPRASRERSPDTTVVELPGGARIGGNEVVVVVVAEAASPAPAPQLLENARRALGMGATVVATLPREPAHPYAPPALDRVRLEALARFGREAGVATMAEAVDSCTLALAAEFADVVRIGAEHMYDYALLRRAGRIPRPVLLTRANSATLTELLLAAEYLLVEGNARVILCEQGVRGLAGEVGEVQLDVGAVPRLRSLSHLPVLVDPTGGTGASAALAPLAGAAVAAGADGVLLPIPGPRGRGAPELAEAGPESFAAAVRRVQAVAAAVGRRGMPRSDHGRGDGSRPQIPVPAIWPGGLPQPV